MYDVCLMILVPDRSYQFEYISDFKGPENIFQEKLSTTIDNIAYRECSDESLKNLKLRKQKDNN